MQDFLRRFGAYVAVAALVLAGVVYYLAAARGPAVPIAAKTAFFVDEETGAESVRASSNVPPLANGAGKETVVGECKYSVDGGKTTKVAYYFKYTPDVKRKLEATPAGQAPSFDPAEGELVRSPAPGSPWVHFDSDVGRALTEIGAPAGQTLMIVNP